MFKASINGKRTREKEKRREGRTSLEAEQWKLRLRLDPRIARLTAEILPLSDWFLAAMGRAEARAGTAVAMASRGTSRERRARQSCGECCRTIVLPRVQFRTHVLADGTSECWTCTRGMCTAMCIMPYVTRGVPHVLADGRDRSVWNVGRSART